MTSGASPAARRSSDAAPPLRICLVGCGRWGRHILRDLLALGSEVIVVDPAPAARTEALAGGAAAAVAEVDDVPEVSGAVVATPTITHAAVIDALNPRAVPLFCEKPLTADAPAADRLAAAAAGRLFVMDKWRYHPGVEALREIAVSRELGRVVGLRTLRIGWDSPHADVDALWILAPHDLSIGLEVLGHLPAPRAAVAERAARRATGLTGVLGAAPWLVLEVSVTRPGKRRELRLECEGGAATLADAYSDHLLIERYDADGGTRGGERRPLAVVEPPLRRELRAFLAHLAGGPPPKSSAAEGAAIVRTLATLRVLAGLG